MLPSLRLNSRELIRDYLAFRYEVYYLAIHLDHLRDFPQCSEVKLISYHGEEPLQVLYHFEALKNVVNALSRKGRCISCHRLLVSLVPWRKLNLVRLMLCVRGGSPAPTNLKVRISAVEQSLAVRSSFKVGVKQATFFP